MTRRVVVTGLGMVTPLGHDVETTWNAIKNGKSGVGKITLYDASDHLVQIAAEVKEWDPTQYVDSKDVRRKDRYQIFAYAAAMQAWKQAGFEFKEDDERWKTSVIVGSSVGGVSSFQDQVTLVHDTKNVRKVTPFGIPMLVVNGASNMISIELGINGPSQTLASACSTGTDCIGYAVDLIRMGRINQALAGCGEAPIIPIGIGVFDRMTATSRNNEHPQEAMRPFDMNRDGLVFAEGAAVLMLEEYESAKARGAEILAEVIGYGNTSDAFHVTAPEPEGMGASMALRFALKDAGINSQDVDYISAHGTSTALNDPMETKAVKRVFGAQAYNIPMSSTKSMTGHGMGMTAALESAFCVLAIRDQVAPPTINLHEPDPECDLDYVPNEAREVNIEIAMNNAFGFGGHNSSILFKKI